MLSKLTEKQHVNVESKLKVKITFCYHLLQYSDEQPSANSIDLGLHCLPFCHKILNTSQK